MNTFLSGPMSQYLRNQGRLGDTELAHVNPEEAALLRSLGGSGTINPSTGLREYYSEEEENEGGWSGVGDDGNGNGNGNGNDTSWWNSVSEWWIRETNYELD